MSKLGKETISKERLATGATIPRFYKYTLPSLITPYPIINSSQPTMLPSYESRTLRALSSRLIWPGVFCV